MFNRDRAVFAPADGGGGGDAAQGGEAGGGAFDWGGALGDKAATFQPMLQTKGWKTPADALTAYQNLEGLSGRMVAPPGPDAKPEDWNPVWDKLGRPKDPAGYTSVIRPTDLPADFLPDDDLTGFRTAAHGAGLNEQQARTVFDWFTGRGKQQFDAARANDAKVEPELRGKWGAAYDANVAVAQRAVKAFGGDPFMDVLERRVGGTAMVEFFHKIGAAMGEDTLAGNGGGGGFGGGGQADAQRQIAELQGNADFQKAYLNRSHAGHDEAVRKMQGLFRVAHPDQKG